MPTSTDKGGRIMETVTLTKRNVHAECIALLLGGHAPVLICPDCCDAYDAIEAVLRKLVAQGPPPQVLVDDETSEVSWVF